MPREMTCTSTYSIRNSEGIGCKVINEKMREYFVISQLVIYEEPLVTYELAPDPFEIYFNRRNTNCH